MGNVNKIEVVSKQVTQAAKQGIQSATWRGRFVAFHEFVGDFALGALLGAAVIVTCIFMLCMQHLWESREHVLRTIKKKLFDPPVKPPVNPSFGPHTNLPKRNGPISTTPTISTEDYFSQKESTTVNLEDQKKLRMGNLEDKARVTVDINRENKCRWSDRIPIDEKEYQFSLFSEDVTTYEILEWSGDIGDIYMVKECFVDHSWQRCSEEAFIDLQFIDPSLDYSLKKDMQDAFASFKEIDLILDEMFDFRTHTKSLPEYRTINRKIDWSYWPLYERDDPRDKKQYVERRDVRDYFDALHWMIESLRRKRRIMSCFIEKKNPLSQKLEELKCRDIGIFYKNISSDHSVTATYQGEERIMTTAEWDRSIIIPFIRKLIEKLEKVLPLIFPYEQVHIAFKEKLKGYPTNEELKLHRNEANQDFIIQCNDQEFRFSKQVINKQIPLMQKWVGTLNSNKLFEDLPKDYLLEDTFLIHLCKIIIHFLYEGELENKSAEVIRSCSFKELCGLIRLAEFLQFTYLTYICELELIERMAKNNSRLAWIFDLSLSERTTQFDAKLTSQLAILNANLQRLGKFETWGKDCGFGPAEKTSLLGAKVSEFAINNAKAERWQEKRSLIEVLPLSLETKREIKSTYILKKVEA